MPRQAVEQGDCSDCDDEQDLTLLNVEFLKDDEYTIEYTVRCPECRQVGTVSVSTEGTDAGEGFTHEDATWNEEADD